MEPSDHVNPSRPVYNLLKQHTANTPPTFIFTKIQPLPKEDLCHSLMLGEKIPRPSISITRTTVPAVPSFSFMDIHSAAHPGKNRFPCFSTPATASSPMTAAALENPASPLPATTTTPSPPICTRS